MGNQSEFFEKKTYKTTTKKRYTAIFVLPCIFTLILTVSVCRCKWLVGEVQRWWRPCAPSARSPKGLHHQRIETVRFKGCASWYSPHSSIANQNGLADLCLELRNLSTKPFSIFFRPLFCDFLQKKRIEWRRKNFYFASITSKEHQTKDKTKGAAYLFLCAPSWISQRNRFHKGCF